MKMVDLGTLMTLDGAIGAFKMTESGELVDHKVSAESELNEIILDLLCHVCVANMAIATMQARGWEKMTDMKGFYPVNGFSLVGFEWTAIVNGEFGVVISNDKTDFEAAYAALNS
jgi:roadblock/LC7 domain-containing protein